MAEKPPITAQELKELFGNVDLEQLIWDSIVEKWMSQVHPHDMDIDNLTYYKGFSDSLDKLRSNLRQDT